MEHTPECIENIERTTKAIQEWGAKWPHHCTYCLGTGMQYWTENQSPLGSGENWPMNMQDICWCQDEGKCPRCGTKFEPECEEDGDGCWIKWMADSSPCPACGWDWGKNADDACPPVWECYCWEIAALKEEL